MTLGNEFNSKTILKNDAHLYEVRFKMSKKGFLADILFNKLNFITLPITNILRPKVFCVLAYHRVFSLPDSDYPFSSGTISASPEEFDRQMKFVSKNFHVINFKILSDLILSGEEVPNNLLIITFDDGYADNYELAFSTLQKYNLTATIFLTTSNIDSGEIFWYDKLHYILRKTSQKMVTFDSGKYTIKIEDMSRHKAIESANKIFNSVSNKDRLRFFQQLEEQSEVTILHNHLKLANPLNWHKIKEMSKYGIEFGSHTISHPYLSNMSNDEIMYELVTSKKSIQEKLGIEVKSISYPFGSYNKEVMECAKISGYQFGIAYEHNTWRFDRMQTYAIPRIHVEPDVGYSLFQANLLFPQLFVRPGL
jgi:peptidoglycan/xylan/chitin deacetylase (PgdA/CDA1 family)